MPKKQNITDDGGDCILCGTFNKHINEMLEEYEAISLYDYAQVIRKEEEREQTLSKEQETLLAMIAQCN